MPCGLGLGVEVAGYRILARSAAAAARLLALAGVHCDLSVFLLDEALDVVAVDGPAATPQHPHFFSAIDAPHLFFDDIY